MDHLGQIRRRTRQEEIRSVEIKCCGSAAICWSNTDPLSQQPPKSSRVSGEAEVHVWGRLFTAQSQVITIGEQKNWFIWTSITCIFNFSSKQSPCVSFSQRRFMCEVKLFQSVCNVFDPLQNSISLPISLPCSFPPFFARWTLLCLISVRPSSNLLPITCAGDVFQTSADVHITACQPPSADGCLHLRSCAVFICSGTKAPQICAHTNGSCLFSHSRVFAAQRTREQKT